MASTVPSSTQNTWSWMIWLCAYSAGIGPVTPITWSVGWFRYWCIVFVRARGLLAERGAGLEVQERDDRGGVLRGAHQQTRGVRQRERSGQTRDAAGCSGAGLAGAGRPGQTSGTQPVGRGQRLGHSRRLRRPGELAQLARYPAVCRQCLTDRTDLRHRRQAPRIPLHDGDGRVEREAEQPARVALRVRRRRSWRDQLGQPARGGVQRRQEDDGGRYGSGPSGDDQEPQADHYEGVTPGHRPYGRFRPIWNQRPYGRFQPIWNQRAYGRFRPIWNLRAYGRFRPTWSRRHEDRPYPRSGALLL